MRRGRLSLGLLGPVVAGLLTLLLLIAGAPRTAVAAAGPASLVKPALKLEKGDRIVFIGNTFAERMQLFSYFETMLTAAHPELDLTFRNLGWSADTLTLQPRPLNFGPTAEHLMRVKPTVIFVCYGMAESFDGTPGLSQFEKDLASLLTVLRGTPFNGKAPPQVVVVSPIAHENLGGHMPDPAKRNDSLSSYTDVMRRVSDARKVPFIDLFSATAKYAQDNPGSPLTFNGIHLTQYGDWVVSQMMLDQLGMEPRSWSMPLTVGAGASRGPVKFKVSSRLPLSPPPRLPAPAALLSHQPKVTVATLDGGTYELRSSGKAVAKASNAAWAKGVRISGGAGHDQVERLRQLIIHKNQLFFFRYRPVNGEYVFGRRAQPFGVQNFPGEMQKLDELIAEAEQEIWRAAQPMEGQEFELIRVAD